MGGTWVHHTISAKHTHEQQEQPTGHAHTALVHTHDTMHDNVRSLHDTSGHTRAPRRDESFTFSHVLHVGHRSPHPRFVPHHHHDSRDRLARQLLGNKCLAALVLVWSYKESYVVGSRCPQYGRARRGTAKK